jgi:hypothetical protein
MSSQRGAAVAEGSDLASDMEGVAIIIAYPEGEMHRA